MSRTAPPLSAIAPLLLVALAACGGAGSNGSDPTGVDPAETESNDAADRPPLVRAEAIQLRKVRRAIETTSYLESEHRVVVAAKIPGRVVEVLVDEGEVVTKGQPMARLDDREAKSAVRQAELKLADAKVQRDLRKLEVDSSKRREQQMTIERDQANALYDRNAEIGSGLISEQEIEDSKYALDSAEEALRVAEFDCRKCLLEVDAAENTILELETALAAEQLRLDEHQLIAPINGVVSARSVMGGETISSATELFVLVDRDNLVSYLSRPQRELAIVRDAKQVRFTTDAWGDRVFHAKIDVVSPVIDSTTGSFRVRVRVPPEEVDDLRPGMFVRATILTEDERDALMVPKAAIINDGNESVVFAVRDNVAHRVLLDAGIEERDFVECKNLGDRGLAPGDLIIVSGQKSLRDQASVEVSIGE